MGGLPSPIKRDGLTMAHVTGATLWSFAKASWGWKSHCSIPIWMETPRRYLYRDLGWKNSGLNQQNYPVILGERWGSPGMMYFPTKWGPKEPQNPQNHRVEKVSKNGCFKNWEPNIHMEVLDVELTLIPRWCCRALGWYAFNSGVRRWSQKDS